MKPLLVSIGALCISTPSVFAGTLIGWTLEARYYLPDLTSPFFAPVFFTVGSGVEVSRYMCNPWFTINVSASTITISGFAGYGSYPGTAGFSTTSFNGLVFRGMTNSAPEFLSVVVDPSNTMSGLVNSRLTFNENQVTVNFSGLTYNAGTRAVLSVATIPEPGTTALLALSGAALLVRRRRRE